MLNTDKLPTQAIIDQIEIHNQRLDIIRVGIVSDAAKRQEELVALKRANQSLLRLLRGEK